MSPTGHHAIAVISPLPAMSVLHVCAREHRHVSVGKREREELPSAASSLPPKSPWNLQASQQGSPQPYHNELGRYHCTYVSRETTLGVPYSPAFKI